MRPFYGFLGRKGVGISDSCALFVWVGHKFVVFDLWCVIFVGWGDWCVGVSGGGGDANDCINKFAIFNVGRW